MPCRSLVHTQQANPPAAAAGRPCFARTSKLLAVLLAVNQVRLRQPLVLGTDVEEHDCWGLDCYTRRNVYDAVLESGAFLHLRDSPPAAKVGPLSPLADVVAYGLRESWEVPGASSGAAAGGGEGSSAATGVAHQAGDATAAGQAAVAAATAAASAGQQQVLREQANGLQQQQQQQGSGQASPTAASKPQQADDAGVAAQQHQQQPKAEEPPAEQNEAGYDEPADRVKKEQPDQQEEEPGPRGKRARKAPNRDIETGANSSKHSRGAAKAAAQAAILAKAAKQAAAYSEAEKEAAHR